MCALLAFQYSAGAVDDVLGIAVILCLVAVAGLLVRELWYITRGY